MGLPGRLLLLGIMAACLRMPAADDDSAVQTRINEVHGLIWCNYIQQETWSLLTRLDMAGKPFFVRGVRESPSIEDASLYGSIYLDALVQRYEVNRKPGAASEARSIFRGLIRNCTIIPSEGLLARGIHPDGKVYWGDPSTDQYTGVVFGLWRYYRSSLATAAEKKEIADVIRKMVVRLERDRWTILDEQGKPTRFGDIGALTPTRAERLLALLLAGYDITRDNRLLQLYAQEKKSRLPLCGNYTRRMGEPWVQLQNAMALRILLDLATDKADLAVFGRGARTVAEVCAQHLAAYRQIVGPDGKFLTRAGMIRAGFWNEKSLTTVLRNPWDAIFSILLLEDRRFFDDALSACREMILGVPFPELRYVGNLFQAENNYWLAVRHSLLKYNASLDGETRDEAYRVLRHDVYSDDSRGAISLR
ncbi:MAG: hypothetical protein ABFD60_08230 [Bryobacteraceae bacterium]